MFTITFTQLTSTSTLNEMSSFFKLQCTQPPSAKYFPLCWCVHQKSSRNEILRLQREPFLTFRFKVLRPTSNETRHINISYRLWEAIFSRNTNDQTQCQTWHPPAQPLRLRVQADGAGSGTEGGKQAQRRPVYAHTQGGYSPGSSPVEKRRTRERRRGPVRVEGSGWGPVGRRATV